MNSCKREITNPTKKSRATHTNTVTCHDDLILGQMILYYIHRCLQSPCVFGVEVRSRDAKDNVSYISY